MHSFTNFIPILAILAVSAIATPVTPAQRGDCVFVGACSKLESLPSGTITCPDSMPGKTFEQLVKDCCGKGRTVNRVGNGSNGPDIAAGLAATGGASDGLANDGNAGDGVDLALQGNILGASGRPKGNILGASQSIGNIDVGTNVDNQPGSGDGRRRRLNGAVNPVVTSSSSVDESANNRQGFPQANGNIRVTGNGQTGDGSQRESGKGQCNTVAGGGSSSTSD